MITLDNYKTCLYYQMKKWLEGFYDMIEADHNVEKASASKSMLFYVGKLNTNV